MTSKSMSLGRLHRNDIILLTVGPRVSPVRNKFRSFVGLLREELLLDRIYVKTKQNADLSFGLTVLFYPFHCSSARCSEPQ